MKQVLLLGDSIRLNYQPLVKEKLDGLAEVVGPVDNCRFAKYTLWYVNQWLDEHGKPDIIHWNNGLWDVFHYNEEMGISTPLEEYKSYIKKILKVFKRTGSKIIWATTTPAKPQNINYDNNEIDRYNDEIIKYMVEEQIEINDLNKIVKSNIDSYIADDNLHLSEAGKEVCAEAVAKAIKKYL